MMPGGEACVLLAYDHGSFNEYWEGSLLRSNQTIETVNRRMILPMAAVGITDRLNFYVGLPHVKTWSSEPNGGRFRGAAGFQDIILALKYQAVKAEMGKGVLSAFGSLGFSTPATNYLPDYLPYSIGMGAPELAYRGIAQYRLHSGLYLRAGLGYLWRGYAQAERDYYYNNGSYYTDWMDVPSAWSIDGALGWWLLDNSLQIELSYAGQRSTSGDDIRAYNAAQPTNRVHFDRMGLQLQYFTPFVKGLGIIAYHNRILSGRNAPKMNNTAVGLTYQFAFFTKKENNTL